MDEEEISTPEQEPADGDIPGAPRKTSISRLMAAESAEDARVAAAEVHRLYEKNARMKVVRRVVNLAWGNGINGFRAAADLTGRSVYNVDPLMRLQETNGGSFRRMSTELEGKAMAASHPLAEGLLLTYPRARKANDPKGFLVTIPLVDYLELVARARHLVFTD